ncbi:hypothetical protein AOLI_G00158630 [Acnodon oligacanthus]
MNALPLAPGPSGSSTGLQGCRTQTDKLAVQILMSPLVTGKRDLQLWIFGWDLNDASSSAFPLSLPLQSRWGRQICNCASPSAVERRRRRSRSAPQCRHRNSEKSSCKSSPVASKLNLELQCFSKLATRIILDLLV